MKSKTKKPRQTSRTAPKIKWQLWAIAIALLAIVAVVLLDNSWVKQNLYRMRVERTITSELAPLRAPLQALGFSDFTNLTTECATTEDPTQSNGVAVKHLSCSSRINRFVHVPTGTEGKAQFNQHAQELSKALQANGWKQREDLPTIPWFQKISEGVDYQPDQLNTKTVNGMDCMIDFYTAFSKPQPAALSLQASCTKSE